MFLHIATNIKDMNKLKGEFENKSKINMDDYKKEIYNLADILTETHVNRDTILKKMFESLASGRKDNILVILFYDKVEDIKEIYKNEVIINNCYLLEDSK